MNILFSVLNCIIYLRIRFDYKPFLTCLDKFIGTVWDSLCMHFEGGKTSGLLTEARQLNRVFMDIKKEFIEQKDHL